jgi:GTP-binding protein
MFEDEAATRAAEVIAELGWTHPWYVTSAVSREGTWPIMKDVMAFFDRLKEDEQEARDAAG